MSAASSAASKRSSLPLLLCTLTGFLVGAAFGGAAASGVWLLVLNRPAANNDEKVLELGNTFVQHLTLERLTTAYLSTSAAYQQQTPRKEFDDMVHRHPSLKGMYGIEGWETNVKRRNDGNGYEYYCSVNTLGPTVHFFLTFAQEGGVWKINTVEMSP